MVLGKKYCASLELIRSCSVDNLCKVVQEDAFCEKVRLVMTLKEILCVKWWTFGARWSCKEKVVKSTG